MRKSVLAALASFSLLAACGQAEEPANDIAAAPAVPESVAPPAAAVSSAQAQQVFHERHEGMEQIGKSTKTINQQLKSGTPDLAVVRSNAATIDDLAAKSPNWFPAGTGQDVLHKTRALAAIWQKPEDFAAKDRAFRTAAHAFNQAAQAGQLTAIRNRFEALGETCKACHDNYRAEKHPD